MSNRKYGWKPQKEDSRDFGFEKLAKLKNFSASELPVTASNQQYQSPVEDQGQTSSCTGHSTAGLLQYNEIKDAAMGVTPNPPKAAVASTNIFSRFWQWVTRSNVSKSARVGGAEYHDLSRLFIYYNGRALEGGTGEDGGAAIRDIIKGVATNGVCLETDWPFDPTKVTVKPDNKCYTDAIQNVIHSYYALNTLDDMKSCIANGNCFVGGIQVYASFESGQVAASGIVPLPNVSTEECLGGHAVLFVAYDSNAKVFLCKNSWGPTWGQKGYFTIGFDYISNPNLASDFWTIINEI